MATFVSSQSLRMEMKKEPLVTGQLPGIVYSHFETRKIAGEQYIAEHGACYIISGNLIVTDAGKNRTFGTGDFLFYRKNFLAKFVKQPLENQSFKAITVVFDRNTLLEFSKQYGIIYERPYATDEAVLKLEHSVLLENFYQSLIPYFDSALPDQLVTLKKQEALMLLLQINPQLKNMLLDFSQPGKINLEDFMQQNFRFNVDMKKMAFLTGRSLASFKRDFEKIFHTSPSRWIQQRRLEEAHYLISEKARRPSDVYHEVGFETISHFSYSFKQFYGVNPSSIRS